MCAIRFWRRSLRRGTLRGRYPGWICWWSWEIRGLCAGSRYSGGGLRRLVGSPWWVVRFVSQQKRVCGHPIKLKWALRFECGLLWGRAAKSRRLGPTVSASRFEWACSKKSPNPANGGLLPPYEEDGLYQFNSPRTFPTGNAVTLGHASDQSLRRILTGAMLRLINCNASWWALMGRQWARWTWRIKSWGSVRIAALSMMPRIFPLRAPRLRQPFYRKIASGSGFCGWRDSIARDGRLFRVLPLNPESPREP